MTVIGVAMIGYVSWRLAVDHPPALSGDEQFMKAQFCSQTGRIPYVSSYNVVCYDYVHNTREDAP